MRLAGKRADSGIGELACSFCGKTGSRRRKIIERSDGLRICSECVERVIAGLSEDALKHAHRR